MNKKILSTLLVLFLAQPISCFAEILVYDNKKSIKNVEEIGDEYNFTIYNEDNTTLDGTQDVLSLYEGFTEVPVNSSVSILDSDFCKISSEGYDSTLGALAVDCGEDSEFQLSVSIEDDNIEMDSINGTANVFGIPLGKKFKAIVKNNDIGSLNCTTYVAGSGMDTTPEPDFPIFLKCFSNSAKSILSGMIAALLFFI